MQSEREDSHWHLFTCLPHQNGYCLLLLTSSYLRLTAVLCFSVSLWQRFHQNTESHLLICFFDQVRAASARIDWSILDILHVPLQYIQGVNMIYHNIVCLLTYPSPLLYYWHMFKKKYRRTIISKPSRPGAWSTEQHQPAQGRRDLARAPQLLHP